MFVLRKSAEKYYINIAVFSILTILVTRIFLELTGYPQVGNDTLHIAHLLWGGLFLFLGSIFLLVLRGKRIEAVSSIFVGIGWGLFLDELGKFITVNNDYWFKPAAPLIYIITIISFIPFFVLYKRNSHAIKSRFYSVLENISEILEKDFDQDEKNEALNDLSIIIKSDTDDETKTLAKNLISVIKKHDVTGKDIDTPILYKISNYFKKEFKVVAQKSWLFATILFALIIRTVLNAVILGTNVGVTLISNSYTVITNEDIVYLILLLVKVILGIVFSFVIFKAFRSKELSYKRFGRLLAIFSLILVNTIFMYFNQFNTFSDVIFDLFLYIYLGFI